MPLLVKSAVDVSVARGPGFSAVHAFQAGGYSVLEISVDAGDSASVPFHPGPVSGLALIFVTASRYDPADLAYELGGETIALDGPQLFSGAGMLSRFGSDPDTMTVSNDLAEAVQVKVLVGRTAP